MTFTTNTSMTNGLDVPQLLRSPSTSNTSVSVGDKVKIVYRALQIDGYSSNDSLRTSCGLIMNTQLYHWNLEMHFPLIQRLLDGTKVLTL